MSFQFRFASLLDLRRRERDEAGAHVGQAIEAIQRVDDRITEVSHLRTVLRDGNAADRHGEISVDGLLSAGRYDIQLEAEIENLRQARGKLTKELSRRQQRLVAAEAEVKRYERLESSERTAFENDRLRREQFEADEASMQRYLRNARARNENANGATPS